MCFKVVFGDKRIGFVGVFFFFDVFGVVFFFGFDLLLFFGCVFEFFLFVLIDM